MKSYIYARPYVGTYVIISISKSCSLSRLEVETWEHTLSALTNELSLYEQRKLLYNLDTSVNNVVNFEKNKKTSALEKLNKQIVKYSKEKIAI